MRQGQTLAELPVTLAPADASGRIQQVNQIPAGGLGAGDVVLRLVVTRGGQKVVREASLTIEITG
jgi:hypothetical protein